MSTPSERRENPPQGTHDTQPQWYGSIRPEQLSDLEDNFAYLTVDGSWHIPDWLCWLQRQAAQRGVL